jgi:hypothetical protein
MTAGQRMQYQKTLQSSTLGTLVHDWVQLSDYSKEHQAWVIYDAEGLRNQKI